MTQSLSREPGIDRELMLSQVGEGASVRDTIYNALNIAMRELRDSFRDWRIITPIFIFTLLFPFLANIASALFIGLFDDYDADTEAIFDAFLPLMPMIVGFFPISISLVIALESFVGEKERRSLEPLLSTPLTNLELYIGKVIAAMIPPLLASYLGVMVYLLSLLVTTGRWSIDTIVLIQIMVLTTVQAAVMVTGAVVISSQTTSTRAANLLASVILLPMSLITIVEALVIINVNQRYILWYVAFIMLIVVILLVRIGIRIFNREEMLGRAIDNLNLGWIFKTVWQQFLGIESVDDLSRIKAMNPRPINWWRRTVPPALSRLRRQGTVVLIAMVIGAVVGIILAYQLDITPEDQRILQEHGHSATAWQGVWDKFSTDYPLIIDILDKLRPAVAIIIIGSFTFGAIGAFVPLIGMVIFGLIIGLILREGLDPMPVLIPLMPHGIFETLGIFLAGAAGLRTGSIVTAKLSSNQTIGEVWLRAIGDAFRILIGVVLPLMVIAVLVERYVTPLLVEWVS